MDSKDKMSELLHNNLIGYINALGLQIDAIEHRFRDKEEKIEERCRIQVKHELEITKMLLERYLESIIPRFNKEFKEYIKKFLEDASKEIKLSYEMMIKRDKNRFDQMIKRYKEKISCEDLIKHQ